MDFCSSHINFNSKPAHSIFLGAKNSSLKNSQLRSDMLTQLVELKMQYRQYVNEIHRVHLAAAASEDTAYTAKDKGLRDEMDGYYEWTKKRYDRFLNRKLIPSKYIEEVRHHIEALKAKSQYEKADIEELNKTLNPLTSELKKIKEEK